MFIASTNVRRAIPAPQFSFRRLDELIERLASSAAMLLCCKLVIGAVSAYDIFLTIKYFESLPAMELNPIGRWMMSLDDGPKCDLDQISCFIACKFAGNFIALSVIEALCSWKRYMATAVAFAIACFQLMLLYFLLCD